MGCDVHMMIEYDRFGGADNEPRAWWSFGGVIGPGRDYDMFGHLAGVRYEENEHIRPRGLPDNLSYDAKDYFDNDDIHSVTWLTYEEYAAAYGRRMFGNEHGPPAIAYEVILVMLKAFKDRDVPARLIIGFDN